MDFLFLSHIPVIHAMFITVPVRFSWEKWEFPFPMQTCTLYITSDDHHSFVVSVFVVQRNVLQWHAAT